MNKVNSSCRITENEEENFMKFGDLENNISIICPSPKGKEIALQLQKNLGAELYIKEYEEKLKKDFNLSDITKKVMKTSKGIIFISSTGIAVRAIAPFLEGKDKDPGVVVVDLACKYAINILSGHLGGGNELTIKIAEILKVKPIITTATDNLGIIAPDVLAKKNGLIIENLKKAKYIASLLVEEKTVGIKDDYNEIEIGKGYEIVQELRENCIWITHNLKFNLNNKFISNEVNNIKINRNIILSRYNDCLTEENKAEELNYSKILRLIKKDLILGIGCRRDTAYEKLYDFINTSLIKYNLDIKAVVAIASVDVKKDEAGIIELAEKFDCPFKTFSREEIKTVQDKYERSEFVLKTLGVTGICEPSVDLAGGEVIISKVKKEGMTLAIGVLKKK
ncbi:cobalamin biosynthesis protein CbiG [Clostridium puniceum]|uniref:Cobalamin biosynthesis protein CbiG n=2 Tax=Clostridium puniceum TaxID=29367 RepID=A0A1S8TDI3_9CLOT|nr:cobalamin biosynthesis protein CbiG [Clostridium puniceum]